MPFVDREGACLFWRLDGHPRRPPLVLLNSLGTDHTLWEPVMTGLMRRFLVLRVDKPGHGCSQARPGEYTLDALADDVLAAMDAAGLARAHLCGVSIGGMLALVLATRDPARWLRLVLSNTSAQLAPEGFVERIARVREGGVAAVADAVLGRFFTAPFVRRADEHYHNVRRTLLQVDPIGYVGCCAAVRDMAVQALPARIALPTLVITGDDDRSTPPAMGTALAAAIPGARHAALPCAHLSHVEAPGRFVELLEDHCLADTPGEPPARRRL